MIAHSVAFRFDDSVGPDHAARALEELRALVGVIPSLRGIVGGPDLGFADGNYHLAFLAFFDDEAGWRAYQEHPAHVEYGSTWIRPHLAARAAAQFAWSGPLPV